METQATESAPSSNAANESAAASGAGTWEHETLHTAGAAPRAALSSLDTLKAWARANPQAATLGAFAVGVFIGVLMRR